MIDIRMYTGIIIEKDSKYLVGKAVLGGLVWSDSPYDAWRTRDIAGAYMVEHYVGGRRMLFNPVARQLREMRNITES